MRDMVPSTFIVDGSTGAGEGTEMGYVPGFGGAVNLPKCRISALVAVEVFQYPCDIKSASALHGGLDLVFCWSTEYSVYVLLFTDQLVQEIDRVTAGHVAFVLTAVEREAVPKTRSSGSAAVRGNYKSVCIFRRTNTRSRRAHTLTAR